MEIINPRLYSWAVDGDPGTLAQAQRAASLPVVFGHVALMPDAHVGIGATIGSVIPTEGSIIPSAVGVDIGCGMAAIRLDLRAEDLPENLQDRHGVVAALTSREPRDDARRCANRFPEVRAARA